MSGWIFLKAFCDLCLYFSVIGAFPTLFAHRFSYLWAILLCSGGASLAAFLTESGKEKARFLGILLPAASLLMAGSISEWAVLLPAVLYALILILRAEYVPEYYGFRQMFLRCLTFLGFFYLVSFFLVHVESVTRPDDLTIDYESVLCYGLMYALTGFILLRQLRMGKDTQGRTRVANGVQIAAVLAGTGLLTAGILLAERYLCQSAVSLLKLLWNAFGLCIGFLGWLLGLLFQGELTEYQEELETQAPTVQTSPTFQGFEPVTGPTAAEEPVREMGYPWWAAVLILTVMIAMLVFMLKTFRSRGTKASVGETVEKTMVQNPVKKESRRSNRSMVRRYYREFLKTEKKRGRKLRTNQTSADILLAVSPGADFGAAAELREVYLAARYDETRDVTSEDLKKAKIALKQYRDGDHSSS